ncbi:MAG TPA: SDR family oxidoreductase [Clostridiales bacterium]|nr:SDR family oxidoreductase [Clostridiales bacterium]HOL92035.1 SDR family oxidoreductase [Clostridiales bacterium]HPP36072.1 SDR family oxidoreductase [Clostridiales bacterium]
MDLFSLEGRKAALLGGGGVLGAAMAKGLVDAGADVAVCDLDLEKAQAVVDSVTSGKSGGITCEDKPRRPVVKAYRVDAMDIESIRATAAAIFNDFGRVDILVNAVGGNMKGATTSDEVSFFDLDAEMLNKVVKLNLMAGAVLPSQVFGREMVRNKNGGVIINISSMNAFRPLTRIPGYSAAKAAVSNFTQWLATDLAKKYGDKIRVNAIAPGFFLTEQNRFLLTDPETGEFTRRGKTIIEHTPMGRLGRPEDLIGTLIWLCSDASRFVTGIVVPVDGGFSAFSGV